MTHFSTVVKQQLGKVIHQIEGGGAAGGIAAGLYGLLNAQIQSGIDTILELTGFEQRIQDANWVISGEGSIDTQTLQGKVIKGVLDLSQKYQKDLILFVGQNQLSTHIWKSAGITHIDAILAHTPELAEALEHAAQFLEQMAFEYFRNHITTH